MGGKMKGYNIFSVEYNDYPYRKLLCDVVKQAVNYAMGQNLSEILGTGINGRPTNAYKRMREQERAKAIAYLMSSDFEEHAYLLGIDEQIGAIREMVTTGEYQNSLFAQKIDDDDKSEIREMFIKGHKTKELAVKFGVSARTIQAVVQEVRYLRRPPKYWQQKAKSRKVEMSG
jgi:hypothetical protein